MRKRVLGIVVLVILAALGATAAILVTPSKTAAPAKTVGATTTNSVAQAFIDQGKAYLQAHNILAARDQFSQALTADPDSQEANLLYGIVRVFSIVEDGQSLNTAGLDSVREILELSGAIIQNFNIYGSSMQMGKGPASTTPRTGEIIDFLKNKALPEVNGAIANLLKVTDPAILYAISPAAIAQNTGSTIYIDFADAMVVRSLLYALKCNLELLMVYGLDVSIPSIYDNPDQLMTYKAIFQQDATFLTPKDPDRLDIAKAALISFIDTYTTLAVPRLSRRVGAGHHLFVIDAPVGNEPVNFSVSEMNDISSKLAEVKASLSGPHVFSFIRDMPQYGNHNTQIDLSKFFNSAAPLNIRASLTNCTTGAVFPDTTFNGLFPLGIDGYQQFVTDNGADLLGVACTGRETPAIRINPENLNFNEWNGFSSGPQAVTISSYGTAPLTVSSISLSGPNSADLTLSNGTCSSYTPVLTAGTSCSVVVDLKRPVTTSGNISASLQVASNDISIPVASSQIHGWIYPTADGSISGMVRDAKTGEGIQNGYVALYDGVSNAFLRSVSTNYTGGYTFNGLGAGSYKLYFGGSASYVSQWYNNKTSQGSADVVTLGTNENRSNINADLITPATTLNWGSVWHQTKADGTQFDVLDAGINTNATTLSGMAVKVEGPQGFTYSFTEADKIAYLNGRFSLFKSYPSGSLVPGVYTFTMTDSNGNVSYRQSTRPATVASLPRVDSATIRYQRKSDGTYRFSWAPVNDTRTYYYRLRIALNDSASTPVFLGARNTTTYVDVPQTAGSANPLADGTAYKVRVEVIDAQTIDLTNSRSDSTYISFTPQAADYNPSRLLVNSAVAYNRTDSNGVLSTDVNLTVNTPASVSSVDLRDSNGAVIYNFLASDRSNTDFYHKFTPALTAGSYTIHFVANGLDHFASATLTAPVVYPMPDTATMQAEDQGNGYIRFSWAGVDHTGPLYYRVSVYDTVTGPASNGPTYTSSRQNFSYVDIPVASLGDLSTKQWRVEVFDSGHISTVRNRVNGAYISLSTAAYDSSQPVIGSCRIRNLTSSSSVDKGQVIVNATTTQGTLTEVRVTGPNGYNRELMSQGRYISIYSGYTLDEPILPIGLYTITAKNSLGKSATRYFYHTQPHALPPVDFRTILVNRELNGDTRISWAPVASDIPVWYSVTLYGSNDLNADGQMDSVYTTTGQVDNNFDGIFESVSVFPLASILVPSSAVLPPASMFRITAMDAAQTPVNIAGTLNNSNNIVHNASQSAMVGYQGTNFNYASLTDGDADGYASNVDANDNNAAIYPFSPPFITGFSLPGTSGVLTVPLLSLTTSNDSAVNGWCLVETNNPGTCVWRATVPQNFNFTSPGGKTLYAFVKNAAGNISSPASASTTISLSYPMSLSFTGTGDGFIHGDMSCTKGATCLSVDFPAGSTVTLMPTPGSNSIFSGWSGSCTNSAGNCILTIDSPKSVSAAFNIMPAAWLPPGTDASNYFGLLTDAYAAASGDATIKAKIYTFIENLSLNRAIAITIKGGYNAGFLDNSGGYSILSGILNIHHGSLTVEGLSIH